MNQSSSYKDEIFALTLALQSSIESIQEILSEISLNQRMTPADIRNLVKNPLHLLKEIAGDNSSMPSVEFKQNHQANPPPANHLNPPGVVNPDVNRRQGKHFNGGNPQIKNHKSKAHYAKQNLQDYINPIQAAYENEDVQIIDNLEPGDPEHHYLGNASGPFNGKNGISIISHNISPQNNVFDHFGLFSNSANNGGLYQGNENYLNQGLQFLQGIQGRLNPSMMGMPAQVMPGMNNPRPQDNSIPKSQSLLNRPLQSSPQPRIQGNPNIEPGYPPAEFNPMPSNHNQPQKFPAAPNPKNPAMPPPLLRNPVNNFNSIPSAPSGRSGPFGPSGPSAPSGQSVPSGPPGLPGPSSSQAQKPNIKRKNYTVEELKSLGSTPYKIRDQETRAECSICLIEYNLNDQISFINCTHFFHTMCLKDWLAKKNECPTCNAEVLIE